MSRIFNPSAISTVEPLFSIDFPKTEADLELERLNEELQRLRPEIVIAARSHGLASQKFEAAMEAYREKETAFIALLEPELQEIFVRFSIQEARK